MWLRNLLFCALFAFAWTHLSKPVSRYEPNWKSLDKRPLPKWYDDAKVGIFLHWGVFSVPGFVSAWFWYYWKGQKNPEVVKFMQKNYRPDFTYADFAPMFHAEFFNPDNWADIFEASGAKYVVLTAKHHEGFCNWDTAHSWNWNSMDVGPKRDLVGDLAQAIRKKKDLKFGLYHSLYEWFNPLYLQDKNNSFKTQDFVRQKTLRELYEIVSLYKPEVIWSDGDWECDASYWNSTEFIAWLYNDSPVKDTVVTNDRWGTGVMCKHGDFYTCNDRYNPGVLQHHKWENCFTIDKKAWVYRRNSVLQDYLTIEEILDQLVSTVSCGGNVLINVGPQSDGSISLIFEERLRQMGHWLSINGQAIYKSKPWTHQNDTVNKNVWYTSSGTNSSLIYAIVLKWPDNGKLFLGAVVAQPGVTKFTLLGYPSGESETDEKSLHVISYSTSGGITLNLPPDTQNYLKWAWVIKIQNAKPSV
ncbi:UNVERIFIED_CONTAM: hypothetical protein GTU68_041746 [Idotea baltica]|nr:hypothetical protein [Idotea baltica]